MASLMILVAGPYRSGTRDNPHLMEKNLEVLESQALEVWKKGHLPVIGEWAALPLMKSAGSQVPGDPVYQEFAYPVARRLLDHCDAVFRLPGDSQGADEDVRLARLRGLPVFTALEDIPLAEAWK